MRTSKRLLSISGLSVHYSSPRGVIGALDQVSLEVYRGEIFGLAGESGCGKSTLALSILKLLPPTARMDYNRIVFDGQDIGRMSEEDMARKIRWKNISIIFQGSMSALNPLIKIGEQIAEPIKLHHDFTEKRFLAEKVTNLLESVNLPPSKASSYPHELSGGMVQRAFIAMALACNPKLLIADEPTTALDVITQGQLIQLIKKLRKRLNLSIIYISHDLSLISQICNRCAIMYAGKIIEIADLRTLFRNPLHPYTQALIGAFPDMLVERTRIPCLEGKPPSLVRPPSGCRFHPRCKYAMEVCKAVEPPLLQIKKGHLVACNLFSERK